MKSTLFPSGRNPAFAVLPMLGCAFALSLALVIAPPHRASAESPRGPARIFVLIVWDGLRPDFVTAERTPNLFAMENEGVRFARHHSVFPTITMVNSATIATGAPPGSTTILGDEVSLLPRL